MSRHTRVLPATLLITVISLQSIAAQTTTDVWRSFAERIAVGTELNVRLKNGQRFRATLVGAQHDVVLLQPKTRIPVPVQAVAYDSILRIEPRKAGQGVGKAVAIGVAAGVGTFFGVMALLVAAVGD
jgi:hypothetical protein